ncbi:hypothetical protein F2Q69_00028757 [Brassica cretica]|uniref:Uncharacterized protein n=1 Tax=Brassica cretica TaxID=69181 RepID=A0A8S9S0T4_BRACR|nr:hypothetical protein F2Q69_00028757 [Brassica cretica]
MEVFSLSVEHCVAEEDDDPSSNTDRRSKLGRSPLQSSELWVPHHRLLTQFYSPRARLLGVANLKSRKQVRCPKIKAKPHCPVSICYARSLRRVKWKMKTKVRALRGKAQSK